jgi:hypothetical protein
MQETNRPRKDSRINQVKLEKMQCKKENKAIVKHDFFEERNCKSLLKNGVDDLYGLLSSEYLAVSPIYMGCMQL